MGSYSQKEINEIGPIKVAVIGIVTEKAVKLTLRHLSTNNVKSENLMSADFPKTKYNISAMN